MLCVAMESIKTCFKCFCHREAVEFEDLHKESSRLTTFNTWCNEWVNGADLAQSGFYFTQCSDLVKCFFCDVITCCIIMEITV